MAGIVYLLVGLVGFVATSFDGLVQNGSDALVGLDLNPFHNVVHIGAGAALIVASRLDAAIASGVTIGIGLVLILAALLGFLGSAELLSIDSAMAADNFLHIATGGAAVIVGVTGAAVPSPRTASAIRQEHLGPGPAREPPPSPCVGRETDLPKLLGLPDLTVNTPRRSVTTMVSELVDELRLAGLLEDTDPAEVVADGGQQWLLSLDHVQDSQAEALEEIVLSTNALFR